MAAVSGQQAANEQRQAANEQQRIAVARQLVTQAESVRDRDQDLALRLALAAQTIHDDPETRSSLAATVTGSRAVGHGSRRGRRLRRERIAVAAEAEVAGRSAARAFIWGTSTRLRRPPTDRGLLLRSRRRIRRPRGEIYALAFTPDGHRPRHRRVCA